MSGKLGHSKDLFILSVSVDDFCRLSFSFKTRTIHLPRDAEGGRKTCDVWLGFAREMSEGRVWSVGNKPGPRRWRRDVCSPSLSSDAGGAGRGSACAGPSHLSRVTTARGETCELWHKWTADMGWWILGFWESRLASSFNEFWHSRVMLAGI